jgi:hypothetical protein
MVVPEPKYEIDKYDLASRLWRYGYRPENAIPGFNPDITFDELDKVCAFLVGEGWSGSIPLSEAVKALGKSENGMYREGG